jgi:hypothetical protein
MGSFAYINTDSRKKVTAGCEFNSGWGFNQTVMFRDVSLSVSAQPFDAFRMSLSTGYTYFWRRQDQFVDQVSYNEDIRTIVGEVSQQTLRVTLRLSYNITPDLTVQYYGQPFITRPLYSNFGYVVDPLNESYDARFHKFNPNEISEGGNGYQVDEDNDGLADYSFARPDFNFVQFRSNLVIRWEYRPGSEFYLVWSQASTPDVASDLSSPVGNSLFDNAFGQQARNIGLVKFTYRFLK